MNGVLATSLSLLSLAGLLAVACGGSDQGDALVAGAGAEGPGPEAGGAGPGGLVLDPNATGGSDSDPGTGTGGQGDGCGFTRLSAEPQPVNMLLVVDKSLSMNEKPSGFDSDKWTALRAALDGAFQSVGSRIAFGLDLYPYSGKSGQALGDDCEMPSGDAVVVPVQDGERAAPLILKALKDNPPGGGTPTAAALARALAYYTEGDGKDVEGEKYVLLATDGGPNCNDDLKCAANACTLNIEDKCPQDLNCCDPSTTNDDTARTKCLDDEASVAAVKALADAGIRTFVIGIPGTEDYADTLNLLASESGVVNPGAPPDYFAVSADGGVEGLSSVLEGITTGLITSCRLQLEEAPPDVGKLFVVIDGELIERDMADGWQLDDDTSPPIIEILGDTCAKLETEGAKYINVTYGCPDFRDPH